MDGAPRDNTGSGTGKQVHGRLDLSDCCYDSPQPYLTHVFYALNVLLYCMIGEKCHIFSLAFTAGLESVLNLNAPEYITGIVVFC